MKSQLSRASTTVPFPVFFYFELFLFLVHPHRGQYHAVWMPGPCSRWRIWFILFTLQGPGHLPCRQYRTVTRFHRPQSPLPVICPSGNKDLHHHRPGYHCTLTREMDKSCLDEHGLVLRGLPSFYVSVFIRQEPVGTANWRNVE